jgi:adenine deaminase
MIKDDSYGKIQKGRIADLVLLNANPLEDIKNTRSINAVVVNGKLLDRAALDRMLQNARRSQHLINCHPERSAVGTMHLPHPCKSVTSV